MSEQPRAVDHPGPEGGSDAGADDGVAAAVAPMPPGRDLVVRERVVPPVGPRWVAAVVALRDRLPAGARPAALAAVTFGAGVAAGAIGQVHRHGAVRSSRPGPIVVHHIVHHVIHHTVPHAVIQLALGDPPRALPGPGSRSS